MFSRGLAIEISNAVSLFCPGSISLGRDDAARDAVCRGGTKLVRAADDEDGEGGARGLRPRWPRKARLSVGEKCVV